MTADRKQIRRHSFLFSDFIGHRSKSYRCLREKDTYGVIQNGHGKEDIAVVIPDTWVDEFCALHSGLSKMEMSGVDNYKWSRINNFKGLGHSEIVISKHKSRVVGATLPISRLSDVQELARQKLPVCEDSTLDAYEGCGAVQGSDAESVKIMALANALYSLLSLKTSGYISEITFESEDTKASIKASVRPDLIENALNEDTLQIFAESFYDQSIITDVFNRAMEGKDTVLESNKKRVLVRSAVIPTKTSELKF